MDTCSRIGDSSGFRVHPNRSIPHRRARDVVKLGALAINARTTEIVHHRLAGNGASRSPDFQHGDEEDWRMRIPPTTPALFLPRRIDLNAWPELAELPPSPSATPEQVEDPVGPDEPLGPALTLDLRPAESARTSFGTIPAARILRVEGTPA
jgi:hypothetical protein